MGENQMGETAWTKKRIEPMQTDDVDDPPHSDNNSPGNTANNTNKIAKEYAVAKYDALIDIPKSFDESILMGTGSGTGTGSSTGTTSGPGDYAPDFNFNMFVQTWKSGIESSPDIIDTGINTAAVAIVSLFYLENTTTEEAQRAKTIIKGQLYRLISLFLSFLVIWNWWYLWNYTTFSFNFENLLNYPPFSILFYIFEPSFKVVELMNYYLLTRRLDTGISHKSREFMRTMWDYRPITFAIFTLIIMGGCLSIPFGDVFVSIFSGNATGIAKIVIIMSIIMYIYVTVNPWRIRSFMLYFFWFPPIIVFIILLLLLLVYLFSRFTAGLFATYLLILSHFTLILFTGLNPFRAIWKIYDDLSTAPVSNANTEDPVEKLGNLLFRNAHTIMLNSILLTIFIMNVVEASTLNNVAALLFIVCVLNMVFIIAMYPAINLGLTVLISIFNAIFSGSSALAEANANGIELPDFDQDYNIPTAPPAELMGK